MPSCLMSLTAATLLAGALSVASPDPDPIETVTSADPVAPRLFEGGTALTFTLERSVRTSHYRDCEDIISDTTPGAELVISGDGETLNGIIIATGDGFNRLIFEDPSGSVSCLAGAGPSSAEDVPVGGFQTLLRRPYGTWRFWIEASTNNMFEVLIEFE